MMQELANWAIETAKRRGASYADVRVMDIRHRDISTKNGEVGTLAESESLGIGIRVIADGTCGTPTMTRPPGRAARTMSENIATGDARCSMSSKAHTTS